MKASTFSLVGLAGRYAEAASLLKEPGDCAVVERAGIRRQILVFCPDGCGETLSINLDPASGPAWRLYQRRGRWSLFPSIDRPTGCKSHFILWSGGILWCEPDSHGEEPEVVDGLVRQIREAMRPGQTIGFVAISQKLDDVPWDILRCCRQMVRDGLLVEGIGQQLGNFMLKTEAQP